RLGVVRSEQDGLVGVFSGALQRLFITLPRLVPEYSGIAIGPSQPDIAELGVRIRFNRLKAELSQPLVPSGRGIVLDLGNPYQVIAERADLPGVALWQGSLDPAPDPVRKRADDLLLDDE